MTTITIDQQLGFKKKHFSTFDEMLHFLQELKKTQDKSGSTKDYVLSGKAFSKEENDAVITDKSELKKYLSNVKG